MWIRKLLGYCTAVLVVSTFGYIATGTAVAVSTASANEADWSFFGPDAVKLYTAGMFALFLLALPVWLVGDTYAFCRNITDATWFVKTGAGAAGAAIIVMSLFTLNSTTIGGIGQIGGIAILAVFAMLAGALGGFVYWASSIRKAGET